MKNLNQVLDLDLPLIQAPIECYPNQAALAASVSEAGCLGVISANFLSTEALQNTLSQVKANTSQPFAVAVSLVAEGKPSDLADTSLVRSYLETAYLNLGLDNTATATIEHDIDDIFHLLLDEKPAVVIFQDGLPNNALVNALKEAGIITMAVTSNLLEAIAAEDSPVDAIILQGLGSAGRQSRFDNQFKIDSYPISTLLHHALGVIRKPLIAWGDYQESANIVSALVNGASAVMLDVPFWSATEMQLPESYLQALIDSNEMLSTVTPIWQGRPSRVIQNKLTRVFQANHRILPSQQHYALMQPIIEAAIARDQADYLPLWAGYCNVISQQPVVELVESYQQELTQLIDI